jgi:DNA-binding NtrC family response regulator
VKKNNLPITLVSSGAPNLYGDMNELLVRLGYKNMDTMAWDELAHANLERLFRVLILPVNIRYIQSQKISLVLQKIRGMPILGVICAGEENSLSDIMKHFHEIIFWPCSEDELAVRIERLRTLWGLIPETVGDNEHPEGFIDFNMVGNSPSFVRVLNQIKKIAGCDASVLIEGETGTGKEMAARAIHYLSRRRDHPFIPVNCGAIPDTLLENELFGHETGAFTDAKGSQSGLISQAEQGTVFLDEVEAFSAKGQMVLLRFLQDHIFKPLGNGKFRKADVRILAASNQDLTNCVSMGEFRRDLFYRLNIVTIKMPTLSQRPGDIELLAEHFLNQWRLRYDRPNMRLHPDTVAWMKRHHWPGNVRELENLLHREFLMSEELSIKLDPGTTLSGDRRKNALDRRQNIFLDCSFNEAKKRIIDQFEKKYLNGLMQETGGNVTVAANRAGKERRALGKLLKKHHIAKIAANEK